MNVALTVTLLLPLERGGTLHEPGAVLTLPHDEAAALIAGGFAYPGNVEFVADRRPVRGHFVTKARP